jgi:hypothetical protein
LQRNDPHRIATENEWRAPVGDDPLTPLKIRPTLEDVVAAIDRAIDEDDRTNLQRRRAGACVHIAYAGAAPV